MIMKKVPKLRFKNFVDEWKVRTGSELFISSRSKGKDYLPLYSVTLDRGMVPRDSLDRRMESEMEAGDNLFVARNDIAYNMMRMWQGAYGLAPLDCMVSPAYVVLHPRENVSSGFFTKYFARNRSLYLFTAFSYGVTSDRLRLYFKDFAQIKFTCPSLPEQQKIASFLSAVDEKIQQLTHKKELLEQYKKGVMQQLFSGRLRFKDENGKSYAKWEEKRLGEIGEIVSGLTYNPDDVGKDGVLVLRSSNVQDRRIVFDDNVYVNVGSGDFNPVMEYDILICVRNGSRDLIGKNAIIGKESKGLAFGAFMTVFRSKYNQYLFHFFDTDSYKKAVHRNLGATINSINGSDLKKFKIPFPIEEEQQKIASYLSALDAKIERVAQQIAHTQTFKKGLLQQMFV